MNILNLDLFFHSKNSLTELLDKLEEADPLFVRYIQHVYLYYSFVYSFFYIYIAKVVLIYFRFLYLRCWAI